MALIEIFLFQELAYLLQVFLRYERAELPPCPPVLEPPLFSDDVIPYGGSGGLTLQQAQSQFSRTECEKAYREISFAYMRLGNPKEIAQGSQYRFY